MIYQPYFTREFNNLSFLKRNFFLMYNPIKKFWYHTHTPASLILFIHFIIFAFLNQFLNPHPDMLDHWVWSRFTSFSYYEHPPMIAWLIRCITLIGGDSEIALEIGSQLVTIIIIVLTYGGTFRLYGKRAALVTLLILCSMPYFTLGSIFLHITKPFLIF